MKAADPVRIIEAAYTHVADETAWLETLVDASAPYAVGSGVMACAVDLVGKPRVRAMVSTPDAAETAPKIVSFVDTLTPAFAQRLFAPAEFVGNAVWRVNRLASVLSDNDASADDAPKLPPLWGLPAGDGKSQAVVIMFPNAAPDFAPDQPFPHRDRKTLGLVGAHIGAVMRLRRAMNGSPPDAVLTPSGRVLDANGEGESKAARRSLSEAVVRSERARGRLRRTDGAEATTLWRALVAGRWSIVESVESDGRRLLVARANPPASPDRIVLTKAENDVVWLVALGHSYKYIAYELGLTVSTVVRRLNQAMPKLGVSSRSELVRKLAR